MFSHHKTNIIEIQEKINVLIKHVEQSTKCFVNTDTTEMSVNDVTADTNLVVNLN